MFVMAALDMATISFLITILPETVATRIVECLLVPALLSQSA
ncbi:hypothetical protein SynRS9915_01306 [Synechococcus sp. RS9915]|nr:hypothetical protein SynRS9915_01306 [Synechococcus sp. RS9915]